MTLAPNAATTTPTTPTAQAPQQQQQAAPEPMAAAPVAAPTPAAAPAASSAPAAAAPAPAAAPVAPAAPVPQLAGGQSLSPSQAAAQAHAQVQAMGSQAQGMMIDGKPLEDVLWENPQRVLDHFTQVAVQKAVNAVDERKIHDENEKRFWGEFYAANPDLQHLDDFVQMNVQQNWQTIRTMNAPDAQKFLAEKTRGFVARARGDGGTTRSELPTGGASSFGGGPQVNPNISAPAAKPKSFIDQVKANQAR